MLEERSSLMHEIKEITKKYSGVDCKHTENVEQCRKMKILANQYGKEYNVHLSNLSSCKLISKQAESQTNAPETQAKDLEKCTIDEKLRFLSVLRDYKIKFIKGENE